MEPRKARRERERERERDYNLISVYFSVLSEQRLSHSKEDPHAPKRLTHDNKSTIFHTWADHSLTVTSITSNGRGNNRKVVTASLDQSCKV